MAQGNASPGIVGFVGAHDVAIGSTVSPFVINGLAPGAAGTVLASNGASSDPSFQSIGSTGAVITVDGDTGIATPAAGVITISGGTTGLSTTGAGSTITLGGTVDVDNGGTGVASLTAHGVLVGNAASPISVTSAGATGTVLSGNTGADPTFKTIATLGGITTVNGDAGSVTPTAGAITINGGSTGLTTSGSGSTLTTTGTLNVGHGGTGDATLAIHGVLIGNAASAINATAVGATGTVLAGNTGADPTFQTLSSLAVTSIAGTANQITASASTGAVTLSTPSTFIAPGSIASTTSITAATALTVTSGTSTLNGNVLIKGPNPWADVIAYGADPTGVADSTTAFNNAIAAFPVGGIVWIPTGIYKITSTITVTTPHIRFCGESRTDSIINWAGSTTTDVFLLNQWYCGFENLTFTTTANTQTAGFVLNTPDTVDYNYCWRCDFNNFWSGINMGGHLSYVDDCQFRTFSNAAANGSWIRLINSHDRWISKVVGDNGSNLTGFAGIRVIQTASLLLRDCSLVHATTCLSLEPTTGLTVPSIEGINNFFDTSSTGLGVTGAGTVARCKFTNCWFSSQTIAGVTLNNANATGITFVNCDFYGNPNGINALAVIDWCVMDSRFAGNTTTGILTTAAAAHSFMIIGCTIGPTSVFGANALGINIQAGTYASYRIRDCIGLQANTTPGITDSGVVANQNQKDVADNLGATLQGVISATTAASGAINTAETLVAGGLNINGATAAIPANSLQIGTTIKITLMGTCTSTAANISTFTLRMGTGGVVGDASVATAATSVAATTGTAVGFTAIMTFTVRTIGTTGTIAGSMLLLNTGITGISANNTQSIPLTATATLNTTTANYIEVTYKSAATTTTSTFQNGIVEIIN